MGERTILGRVQRRIEHLEKQVDANDHDLQTLRDLRAVKRLLIGAAGIAGAIAAMVAAWVALKDVL